MKTRTSTRSATLSGSHARRPSLGLAPADLAVLLATVAVLALGAVAAALAPDVVALALAVAGGFVLLHAVPFAVLRAVVALRA